MRKLKYSYMRIAIILLMLIALVGPSFNVFARPLSLGVSPTLNASASYSILAGTTVTCTGPGPSTTNGDVGVAPGTSITGFPSPCVAGPPGTTHSNDASAIAAQADNLVVFGLLDQACDQSFGAVDLTATFPAGVGPGVYCSTSSFSLSGNLTLLGSGVWIFKTVSTLITSSGSSITGGGACDIWWRVGSDAVLADMTSFRGNIFALTSITLNGTATLEGRALAQNGAVTMASNTITGPSCVVQPLPTATPTFTPSNTPLPSNTPVATGTGTPTSAPVAPTPKKPSGNITDRTPTYKWTVVAGATQYRFQLVKVSNSATIYTVTVNSSACNATTCTKTPATNLNFTNYKWRVRAFLGSWRPWSAFKAFTVIH